MQWRTNKLTSTPTVSVTNGSANITFSTAIPADVLAGDLFMKQGSGESVDYTIASIVDAAAGTATLSGNYGETTDSALTFVVARDITPNLKLIEIADGDLNWPHLYTLTVRRIDVALNNARGQLKIKANESIAIGDCVYVLGWNPDDSAVVVGKADADSDSNMPAVGVATEAVSLNGLSVAKTSGLAEFGSTAFPANSELVVGTDSQLSWSGESNYPGSGDCLQVMGSGVTTGKVVLHPQIAYNIVP